MGHACWVLGWVLAIGAPAMASVTGGPVGFPAFEHQAFPAGIEPRGIAIAELNGDGLRDLAVVDNDSGQLFVFLSRSGAEPGTVQLGDPIEVSVGSEPRMVVAADLDQDGLDDLVVANWARRNLEDRSEDLAVVLNQGDGTFLVQLLPAGFGTSAVTTGDFNGDGTVDLVAVSLFDNLATVYVGDGRGGFTFNQTLSTSDNPQDVTAGDLDKDGDLDLVIGLLRNPVGLQVFFNQTGGGFTSASVAPASGVDLEERLFETDIDAVAVALLDINLDDRLDLAFANGPNHTTSVRLGNGDGSFSDPIVLSNGEPLQGGPRDLTSADMNGDGVPDLIALNRFHENVAIYFGGVGLGAAPPARFHVGPRVQALAAGDLNGDGANDLAMVAREVVTLTQIPEGEPPFPEIVAVSPPVGSVEGGTRITLQGVNFVEGATVTIGGRSATEVVAFPNGRIAAVTPSSEGKEGFVDVVVEQPNGTGTVRAGGFQYATLSSGSLSFTRLVYCGDGVQAPCGTGRVKDVAIGDLNGDGSSDIYVAKSRNSGLDRWFRNLGSLSLENRDFLDSQNVQQSHTLAFSLFDAEDTTVPVVTGGQYDVQLTDINGDGALDAIGVAVSPLRILINNGSGVFVDEATTRVYTPANAALGLTPTGFTFDDVDVADVDLDGDDDIAASNRDNMGPGINDLLLLNNGSGFYTADFNLIGNALDNAGVSRGLTHHDVELADIDGDGDPDLLLSGDSLFPGSPPVILENLRLPSGTLSFQVVNRLFPALTEGCEALETETAEGAPLDFNGDGFVDLFCGKMRGRPDALFLNRGTTQPGFFDELTTGVPFPTAPDTYGADFGDLDRDGDVDIVQSDYGTGKPMIYLNDPSGLTPVFTALPVPAAPGLRGDPNTFWQSMIADSPGAPFIEPLDGNADLDRNGFIERIAEGMRPVLGDLDGDTDLDVVHALGDGGARNVRIYLNNLDPPLAPSPQVDVWMRDTPADNGTTPSSGLIYLSPDLWNRRAPDCAPTPGQPTCTDVDHQDPLFGQVNYLYATVRNRGTQTLANAQVEIYLAKASTGLAWPTNFNTFVGTISVFNLAPGASRDIGPLSWNPPNPSPSDHFCFYIRIVTGQDPISTPETTSVAFNVSENNNIAWRNVTIVSQSGGISQFILRNLAAAAKPVDLNFQVSPQVLDAGTVELEIAGDLFQRWLEAGGTLMGAEVVEGQRWRIIAPEAAIFGLPMKELEEAATTLDMDLTRPVLRQELVLQQIVDGEVVGGMGVRTSPEEDPPPLAEIFADGFESGNTSAWTATVP